MRGEKRDQGMSILLVRKKWPNVAVMDIALAYSSIFCFPDYWHQINIFHKKKTKYCGGKREKEKERERLNLALCSATLGSALLTAAEL